MSERFVVKAGAYYVKVTDEVRPFDKRRTSKLVSRRRNATVFEAREHAEDFKAREEKESPDPVRIIKLVERPKTVWACVCVHPHDKHGADGCVVEECPCLITRTEGFHRPFRGSGATASEKTCAVLREWTRANQEMATVRDVPFAAGVERSIGYVAGLEFALKTLGIRS